MKEYFEKVKTWVMANKTVAMIIGAVVLFFVVRKFGRKTYRRRKSYSRPVSSPKRRRKSLPRSVGMNKVNRSYNRVIKTGRNRGKKAWQIKGSPEAKRRMAAIRRKRVKKLF